MFVVTVLLSCSFVVSVPSVVVVVVDVRFAPLLVSANVFVWFVPLLVFAGVVVVLAEVVVPLAEVVVALAESFPDRLTLWRALALASLAICASVDHFW